jgi:hypothetical protein
VTQSLPNTNAPEQPFDEVSCAANSCPLNQNWTNTSGFNSV